MSLAHPRFRAAAVQAAPVFLDLDAGIERTVALIAEAAANDAQLIAFPETWLPGYPWFIWLDSPAWGMQFFPRYHDNSLEYGTPEAEKLAAAAREHGITVALGLSERRGGSLYIAQWIIGAGRRDDRAASQAQAHPRRAHGVRRGRRQRPLGLPDTPLGRIGGLCCWEHLQPLSKYAMYAQDEQVHIAAWPSFSLYRGGAYALGPEVNTAASRVYAVEGGCFVVAPCATVSPEMIELLCTDDAKKAMLLPGGGFARIYGPDGQMLHEPLAEDAEGLVYADLDLGMISLAKAAADPAGHYARPDVTRLLLNKTPGDRVVSFSAPGVEIEGEVAIP